MDENKSGLYIVAIVGVIAVVSMVVLILGVETKTVSYAAPASATSGDATGQSIRVGSISHGRCSMSYVDTNNGGYEIPGTCSCRVYTNGIYSGLTSGCTADQWESANFYFAGVPMNN
jgi:hypothetical protein